MAHDRTQGNKLPITHEFLALMLGVRRPSVTEAVQELAKQGVLANQRGLLIILDRKTIEKIAGSFYGVPEDQYRRLIR
jgi:Mn-dependent DtxR family transcriptional regulator